MVVSGKLVINVDGVDYPFSYKTNGYYGSGKTYFWFGDKKGLAHFTINKHISSPYVNKDVIMQEIEQCATNYIRYKNLTKPTKFVLTNDHAVFIGFGIFQLILISTMLIIRSEIKTDLKNIKTIPRTIKIYKK